MQDLLDMGISSRRGVMNIHLEPAYDDGASHRVGSALARSEAAQTRSVILPLFAQMTAAECEKPWLAFDTPSTGKPGRRQAASPDHRLVDGYSRRCVTRASSDRY